MQKDLFCPVENRGVTVTANSKTGEPYALLKLFNLSNSVISSLSFTAGVFDENGTRLGEIPVVLEELSAEPKSFFAEDKAVSLVDFPEAAHLEISFDKVDFAEGESYIKSGDGMDVTVNELSFEEGETLAKLAGNDAVCYYQEAPDYWVCVCGRPNVPEMSECIRCGREKEIQKETLSTFEDVANALALKEEEERALLAEKKAKRKKALKKGLTIGGIVLAGALVLAVLVYFIYNFVMVQLGNSAAKKGDYVKAYSHYAAVNNDEKLAEVSEKVTGNTDANILQMGIMTTDEENFYFIDLYYNIYKQSKTTGEKTLLREKAGFFLNAVGEWLYYLDGKTLNSICRVKIDGSEWELVYQEEDSLFSGMTVIGNEIYFMALRPIEGLTPEMQEQMAMQGQNPYEDKMQRLTIGDKKSKTISDAAIAQFIIHRDRVYYVDTVDGGIYYSKHSGGEAKKVVSGPVYSFEVVGDSIYYIDSSLSPETNLPKLSVERTDLEGTHLETVVADKQVINLAADGDSLYYRVYIPGATEEDAPKGELHKLVNGEDTIVFDHVQMFNVRDGYMLHINGEEKLMKSTYDLTGYEEIPAEEIAPAE
ncbi:MAG: DUF5050 domain-containing protein [Clostridia bacterium]|nr:DUF5050 domain-containing protein [Clostridia bacterium]